SWSTVRRCPNSSTSWHKHCKKRSASISSTSLSTIQPPIPCVCACGKVGALLWFPPRCRWKIRPAGGSGKISRRWSSRICEKTSAFLKPSALRARGNCTYCLLPLTTAHNKLGALGFGGSKESAYGPADLRLMERVAELLALAV